MLLKRYDGKCLRITDNYGGVYEGYCYYNSKDYNFHEYGRDEDGLQMLNYLFFKSDIKKIESLEKHKGPYGKFSECYGQLEREIVEDGISSIEDILESEEDEHIYRLLICLNRYYNDNKLDCYKKVKNLLRDLLEYTSNDIIKEEINLILETWR